MKSFLKLSAVFALLGFAVMSFNTAELATYSVDLEESVVVWKARKVTGAHEGTVSLKSGGLEFTDGALTGGSFEMDMTTIDCTDLEGSWKEKLVGHLKSPDFFGVENYPTANFVITKVISRGTPGEYKIVGDMTIKETTKEIKFNTVIAENGEIKTGTANITLDRSEYDIRYGSGSFFDNLGDKTIYDEFDLEITLVLND